MMSLISFFTGAAGRIIIGKITEAFDRHLTSKQELAMLDKQIQMQKIAATNNMEMLKLKASLDLKTQNMQQEAKVAKLEAKAFNDSISLAHRKDEHKLVSLLSGLVRPFLTIMAIMVVIWLSILFLPPYLRYLTGENQLANQHIIDIGQALFYAIIEGSFAIFGWWFGSRSLMPGKK